MTSRSVWAGRYAIFDEIASGGMATVHLACRLGPGETPRVVAVKRLFDTYAKQPAFVTMFLDEAHIAARIQHPNVVRTFEFLRVPDSLALVMELLVGVSFKDLMSIARDRKALASAPVCAAILRDTLQGLHAAHELEDEGGSSMGLVHRDVSPHNIIVGVDGVARVIDFGIAKARGRLQVTEVGIMKGKFAYMAPEQIRAGAVDRRVDIYASGIVLWEALTGRALFRGSADAELFSKRGAGAVTVSPPSQINEAVPSELDEVVLRALAVDPSDRFATAAEMADALAAATDVALPETVAAWVDALAGSRLKALEGMRRAVEASFASGELAGLATSTPARPTASSPPLVVRPVSAPATASPTAASSPAGLAAEAYPAPSPDIPDLAPPQKPPRARTATVRPASASIGSPFDDEVLRDSAAVDLELDLVAGSHARAPTALPALDARAPFEAGRGARGRAPRRERVGMGRIVMLVVFLVVVGGSAGFGPPFIRSTLVGAAARRGLVLSVEAMEPRAVGLSLSGVTVSLANEDVLIAKAAVVDIGLDWTGGVRSIDVPGYEVALHGRLGEVAARLATWRARPHLPIALRARAGHLVWSDAFAAGTTLEGLDMTTTVGAAREDAIHVDIASLTATLQHRSVGPWRAVVDATKAVTLITLNLDRSKSDGPPSVSFESRSDAGSTFSVDIPRNKALQIGIPADLIHAGPDPDFELALDGRRRPSGAVEAAHARLELFAVPTSLSGSGASTVDLVFEGSLGGDGSSRSIDGGWFSVGKLRSRMTGLVVFEQGGVRVQVDRPGHAGPPFVFDTHEWLTAIAGEPPEKPAAEAREGPAAAGHPR